ncbi:MAG: hypothetical protein B7Z73_16275, partial [Planctomycetia bacterium 21-64-5]
MSNYETIDAASPDDHLPPVEPPSAGFIVQLFVIPALIVVIMFALGGGIKWLVERDNNPEAYVDALRRNNDARWQAAHDLADVLRNPRNAKLKDDARLAEQLAGILNKELDEGSFDKNPIELRITDGAASARDVYQFCEYLADLFSTRDKQVIPG